MAGRDERESQERQFYVEDTERNRMTAETAAVLATMQAMVRSMTPVREAASVSRIMIMATAISVTGWNSGKAVRKTIHAERTAAEAEMQEADGMSEGQTVKNRAEEIESPEGKRAAREREF